MNVVTKSAKTTEAAVRLALIELNCLEDEVEIEVLEEATRGFFGLGARLASVRVTKKVVKTDTNVNTRVVEARRTLPSYKDAAENEDQISLFLKEVSTLMGVPAQISRKDTDDDVKYILSGEQMGTLIGRRGDTLDALQYLANIIANKKRDHDRKRIVLDSEGYRSRREDTLNKLAKRLAARVKRTGRKVVLEPMSPIERRMIHTALQNDSEVKTLSEGEEPYRRLVISPAFATSQMISKTEKFKDNKVELKTDPKIDPKTEIKNEIKTELKDEIDEETKFVINTYKSERRYSQRPPKRTYTNVEDVDGKGEYDENEGHSTLW